jgi:hypothetical protein
VNRDSGTASANGGWLLAPEKPGHGRVPGFWLARGHSSGAGGEECRLIPVKPRPTWFAPAFIEGCHRFTVVWLNCQRNSTPKCLAEFQRVQLDTVLAAQPSRRRVPAASRCEDRRGVRFARRDAARTRRRRRLRYGFSACRQEQCQAAPGSKARTCPKLTAGTSRWRCPRPRSSGRNDHQQMRPDGAARRPCQIRALPNKSWTFGAETTTMTMRAKTVSPQFFTT